jgi:formylglycine-generating enzyme required for sulfatase activity
MGDTHGNAPGDANARPAHAVTVKAFRLAKYELTLAE